MDTIKTAFVVALLLAVLYGVYVVLNKEPATPPPEVADMLDDISDEELFVDGPQIDSGQIADDGQDPLDENPNDRVQQPNGGLTDLGSAGSYAQTNPRRSDQVAVPELPDNRYSGNNQYNPYDPGENAEVPDPHADPGTSSAPNLETPLPGDPQLGGPSPTPNPPAESGGNGYGSTESNSQFSSTPLEPELPDSTGASTVEAALQQAQKEIDEQQFVQALLTVSAAYTPDLDDQQRRQLENLLDPLAAKVIYSREHLLMSPYRVRGDETLDQIAEQHKIPAQLLQNINGIENPDVLVSGTVLKVVEGPFRAEVDSERGELTLYLQQMYAGRFPITVGNDPRPESGDYFVESKDNGRPYPAPDGTIVAIDNPQNPYGDVFLSLGQGRLGIHGSASSGPSVQGLGCISLSPRDARDVYGILSEGSRVTILR